MIRLSVVGLGKLGACVAACFGFRGFDTIAMDVNEGVVRTFKEGQAPVLEQGLSEVLEAGRHRINASTSYAEVIEGSDATFIVVPTPSREDGHFSYTYLQDALTGLATALRRARKRFHVFVITSTVSPGTTDRNLIPTIESVSGFKLNTDFGVCYNPAFVALGSVIRDFLNPDIILIGESGKAAGDLLEEIQRAVCQNSPQVVRMSLIGAEITKVSLNSYVTMKISFANTLAGICEALPHADVDAITMALGADRRVSPYGLKAGLPYGGPCFPRDNRAFVAFARDLGVEARLAQATDDINREHTQRLLRTVVDRLAGLPRRTAAILGLAYKPNTPVIEESAAIALVEKLVELGVAVTAYDPLAMDAARARFEGRVRFAKSVKEAIADAALTVVTMPSAEFAAINDGYINHNPAIIIDCWRTLDPRKFGKNITYVALGSHHG